MRGIKVPQLDFALKMQGGFMHEGGTLQYMCVHTCTMQLCYSVGLAQAHPKNYTLQVMPAHHEDVESEENSKENTEVIFLVIVMGTQILFAFISWEAQITIYSMIGRV